MSGGAGRDLETELARPVAAQVGIRVDAEFLGCDAFGSNARVSANSTETGRRTGDAREVGEST